MKEFDVKGLQLKVITKLANINIQLILIMKVSLDILKIKLMTISLLLSYPSYTYYDSVNITDSRLSFKKPFNEPKYALNDDVGMGIMYGLKNKDRAVKQIGDIECVEDVCLIY